jgi:hypothetical protein
LEEVWRPPALTEDTLTRRQLYGICGDLMGHYPIGRWLRVCCSFLRREATGEWDDPVEEHVVKHLEGLLRRVSEHDPVWGVWAVDLSEEAVVSCDASNVAIGVVLEIGGAVVEDACWLRKKNDSGHINAAELESAVKAVNLSIKWGLKKFTLKTDSMTTLGWLECVTEDTRRVKSHGIGELLVRRRLDILRDLIREYDLSVSVEFVPTEKNRADELTRVPKEWLQVRSVPLALLGGGASAEEADILSVHGQHHFGVDRTLELVRLKFPGSTKDAVRAVIGRCHQCKSIDPAPDGPYRRGSLESNEVWN